LQPVCKGSFISYFNKTSKAELFFYTPISPMMLIYVTSKCIRIKFNDTKAGEPVNNLYF